MKAKRIHAATYILMILAVTAAMCAVFDLRPAEAAQKAETVTEVVAEANIKVKVIPIVSEAEEPTARYELTDEERADVERLVMAEAGGEPYRGQMAVAECLLNACEKNDIRPDEAAKMYRYTKHRPEASDKVKQAVSAVFDLSETVVDDADVKILYFYNPRWATSKWHETQDYVLTISNHRFFAEVSR